MYLIKEKVPIYQILSIVILLMISGCQSFNTPRETSSPFTPTSTSSPTLIITNTEVIENITETPKSTSESTIKTLTPTIKLNTTTYTPTSPPIEIIETLPEISPSPTIFQSPTRTIIPTRTPIPTLTRRPSRTPTITPSPTPQLAFYRINNLGMYSKVISPVRPEAIVSPGEDGLIYVVILSEDNSTISKEVFNYQSYINRHIGIAPEIDFELESVSEISRLIITSYDRFERQMWLTSVDLILLAIGKNQISTPDDLTEPYIIRSPLEGEVIQGGMLEVSGVARILNTNPILIECINPEGEVISSTQVELHAPIEGMSHIPFSVFLPYQVTADTNIRLTIRQESNNRIPGTISLFSYEIVLQP